MQAILISAYKDTDYLKRLINFFDKDFEILVHLDKKSKIDPQDIQINSNVHVFKKYTINWGSINHLKAILFLLQETLRIDKNISYIHIISGGDIPVRKLSEFKKFENSNIIYMEHTKVIDLNSPVINRRYKYGNRMPNKDARKRYVRLVNKIYELTHKPKSNIGKFRYNQLYKGLIWLSIPKEVAMYVINYEKQNNFLADLKYVTVPEELYFQTILENSYFKPYIASNNLVFNDWSKPRNGSLPAILDETDYDDIVHGPYFFARKIDKKISRKLIDKISKEINNF